MKTAKQKKTQDPALKLLGADDVADLQDEHTDVDAETEAIRSKIHEAPELRVVPNLSAAEQKALNDDVAARREVLKPIDVDPQGRIVDGLARWIAIVLACLADYPIRIVRGTDVELREYARAANACRRTISGQQRHQMIADQLRDAPQYADRRIAAICGSDHKTVGAIRKFLEASGEIRHRGERQGKDGINRNFSGRTTARRQRQKSTRAACSQLSSSPSGHCVTVPEADAYVPRSDDLPLERAAKLPPGQLAAEWTADGYVRISRHGYPLVDIPVEYVTIGQIVKRRGNRKVEGNGLVENSCSGGCCRVLTGFHASYRPCYSDAQGLHGCFGGGSEFARQHNVRQHGFNIVLNGAINSCLKIRLPKNENYTLPPPVLRNPLVQEWLCRADSETTDGSLSIALGIYQRFVAANPGMKFLTFLSHYFWLSDQTLAELAVLENHHVIHSLSGWFLHNTRDGIIRDDYDNRLLNIGRFEAAGVRGSIGVCTHPEYDNQQVLNDALQIMPRERIFEIPYRRDNHHQEQPILNINPLGACGDYRTDESGREIRFIEENGELQARALLPDGTLTDPDGQIHARCVGCKLQCASKAVHGE